MSANKQEITMQIAALLSQLANTADTSSDTDSDKTDKPIEMLTVKECTDVVKGISERMIRRLVAKGDIPCIRVGESKRAKILISKSALLEYFKEVL